MLPKKRWFADCMDTFVVDDVDTILVTHIIKPNQIDLGSHIANCSYMVGPNAKGKGVGKLLCEHSISMAKEKGYSGIQFNIVVSTNTAAVNLWRKYGFQIIGTTPKTFDIKSWVWWTPTSCTKTYLQYKLLSV